MPCLGEMLRRCLRPAFLLLFPAALPACVQAWMRAQWGGPAVTGQNQPWPASMGEKGPFRECSHAHCTARTRGESPEWCGQGGGHRPVPPPSCCSMAGCTEGIFVSPRVSKNCRGKGRWRPVTCSWRGLAGCSAASRLSTRAVPAVGGVAPASSSCSTATSQSSPCACPQPPPGSENPSQMPATVGIFDGSWSPRPGAAASRAAGGMLAGASRLLGRVGSVSPDLQSRTREPGALPASPQELGGAGAVAVGGLCGVLGSRRLSPSAPGKQPAVGEAILLPPATLPRQRVFKEMLLPYKSHILKFPTSARYCVTTHLLAQGCARGCKQPICCPVLGVPCPAPPAYSTDDGGGFAAAAFVSSRAGRNISDECFARQKYAVLDRPKLFIHSGFVAKKMDF